MQVSSRVDGSAAEEGERAAAERAAAEKAAAERVAAEEGQKVATEQIATSVRHFYVAALCLLIMIIVLTS